MEDQTRQFVFVVSAVDRDGKRTSRKVSAASGRDAIAAVESEGFIEAHLRAEESMAIGGEAVIDAAGVDVDAVFSPDEQLAFGQRGRWGNFTFATRNLYRENLWLVGVAIALPTWEWWRGPVDGQISRSTLVLAGICLLLPIAFAARANLFGSPVDFERMIDSLTWGRWQQGLRLTPPLRGVVRDLELDAGLAELIDD